MKRTFIFYFLCMCAFTFFSCTVNKAEIDNDIKKYFDQRNAEGCFTMLDNSTGKVTVYNLGMDTTRYTPASTFKIMNSLIGLETGKITDEKMVIKWDSIRRTNEDWNADLSMEQAFKVSAVPYYQEAARRIGPDAMKFWVDSISYGNKNTTGPVDSFWLNNHLKISPDEQLGLMKRLFFDQLPFRKSAQEIVKNMMLQEDNTAYKLSYKTGWGFDEANSAIGWVTGWIEENRHVYFFATLIKSKDKNFDMKPVRIAVTKDILGHYGFMKGKK